MEIGRGEGWRRTTCCTSLTLSRGAFHQPVATSVFFDIVPIFGFTDSGTLHKFFQTSAGYTHKDDSAQGLVLLPDIQHAHLLHSASGLWASGGGTVCSHGVRERRGVEEDHVLHQFDLVKSWFLPARDNINVVCQFSV